jgi:hypothetical protein
VLTVTKTESKAWEELAKAAKRVRLIQQRAAARRAAAKKRKAVPNGR